MPRRISVRQTANHTLAKDSVTAAGIAIKRKRQPGTGTGILALSRTTDPYRVPASCAPTSDTSGNFPQPTIISDLAPGELSRSF